MKFVVMLILATFLGWSANALAEDDLDVTMEMVTEEDDEAVSEVIVRDLQLPERASDRARERAEPGLERAREASGQGRDRAEEARERGREARERRGERGERPDREREGRRGAPSEAPGAPER